jgi:hypothetical protein
VLGHDVIILTALGLCGFEDGLGRVDEVITRGGGFVCDTLGGVVSVLLEEVPALCVLVSTPVLKCVGQVGEGLVMYLRFSIDQSSKVQPPVAAWACLRTRARSSSTSEFWGTGCKATGQYVFWVEEPHLDQRGRGVLRTIPRASRKDLSLLEDQVAQALLKASSYIRAALSVALANWLPALEVAAPIFPAASSPWIRARCLRTSARSSSTFVACGTRTESQNNLSAPRGSQGVQSPYGVKGQRTSNAILVTELLELGLGPGVNHGIGELGEGGVDRLLAGMGRLLLFQIGKAGVASHCCDELIALLGG